MSRFTIRRLCNTVLTVCIVVAIAAYIRSQEAALQHASFTTGYIMLGSIVFLALYNIRKKLPFIPLGNSSTWLQLHIYVGLATFAIFFCHVGFRFPNGVFELGLATLYFTVAGSGVLGLYLTRTIPRKLSNLQEEYIYERIPGFQYQVSQSARKLVLNSVAETNATTLSDFYLERLMSYFEQPRSLFYQMFPGSRERRKLMAELSELQRYCSPTGRQISDKMFKLIRRKDDLDYHFALQRILKVWLFLHIGLTYSLLLVAALHTIMAHAFHGGMR